MTIDSLLSSLDISGSGLAAQRSRMDVIANNLANATTTRTAEGGPYKRRDVTFVPKIDPQTGEMAGVDVSSIFIDPTAPRMVYDPTHPDANDTGYVAYPNVSTVTEMVTMLQASRAYEANSTAFEVAKDMIKSSIRLIE